jgi:tetratricopeptide (TPR) repeat protein
VRGRLAAALIACLAASAFAQDDPERALRGRIEAAAGDAAKGAAAAELAKFLESQSRWSEAASEWRQARRARGELADLEGEARTLLAFAEDVVVSGGTGAEISAAFEDARTALKRAREAGAKSPGVAVGLARCAEISGDTATQIEELKTAADAAGDDVRPARALAAAYAAAGRGDEASALLTRLSDARPKDVSLALALYDAAGADEAKKLVAATRAIEAAPEDVRGWSALWRIYSPKQRWAELADAATARAKATPDAVAPAHYAGVACARARRFDEALSWLEKAWTAKDGQPNSRCEAARILMTEKNDRKGAIKLLTEAFALDPTNQQAADLTFFLAKRIHDEGDPKSASPLFEMIAKSRPRDPLAQNNYANSLRFAGRYDECERTYLRYIEAFPNDAQLRNDYALLLDVEGRVEETTVVLRAAHEADPSNNDSMENLGFHARLRGDREEALKWFRLAHANLLAKGENDHKHRINVDDQRWPLPDLPRGR